MSIPLHGVVVQLQGTSLFVNLSTGFCAELICYT